MKSKPKCILTVNVAALGPCAPAHHVDTLIYGRFDGEEWGVGRMMDIADRHHIKMTFFLDFAEVELYGDEIIDVGKYIISRGHDLQVLCHQDILAERILTQLPDADRNCDAWCENEKVSDFIVDYCLEQYRKCGARGSVVFRSGEYRIGAPMLESLKKKGVSADASYNFLNPKKRPCNRQFVFENGLLELPVGILPDVPAGILPEELHRTDLDFNLSKLYPLTGSDWERILPEYKDLFKKFYDYYGNDAIASFLLHSWSFCCQKEHFEEIRYIDRPNPYAPELLDRFLDTFVPEIDFITAAQAVELGPDAFVKMVDYDAVFCSDSGQKTEKLKRILTFIQEKSHGREVVIWGRGRLEQLTNDAMDFCSLLNVTFYISQDAPIARQWRGRPVKTYEEAKITPDRYYVFVIARSAFREIRESLRAAKFLEGSDFFDLQKTPLEEKETPMDQLPPCPICGGTEYMIVHPEIFQHQPRICANCGSAERQRTIPKLFAENTGMECLKEKILHVSPDIAEKKFFRDNNAHNIVSIDLWPELKTDIVADICNMYQVLSDSYDIVFASGVLNCVYDDEAALSEIRRVLRKNGRFISCNVGIDRMKTTTKKEPTARYSIKQAADGRKIEFCRNYGEADFIAQLKRYFSKVRCYEKYDAVTKTSCCWYVCEK